MAYELSLLKEEGYNPITKTRLPVAAASEIDPHTPFIKALEYAQARIKVERYSLYKGHLDDLRGIV